MKYLIYLLAAMLPALTGCNDTDEPKGDPVAPFTLHADRTEVAVGEPVVFTVTSSDGRDVTPVSLICSGVNCYAGNVVTWNLDGTYIMEAHVQTGDPDYPGGVPSQNKLTITVGSGQATYTLSADRELVTVGEPVVFTVLSADGSDVTASCCFYTGKTVYEGNEVSWSKVGSYEVGASFLTEDPAYPDGIPAQNTVTVSVVKPTTTYTVSADRETVKVGQPVVFSVTSSEGGDVSTRFLLREPDGESYLGRTRSYPAAGDYVVEAYLKSDPNVVSSNRVTVKVSENTAPVDNNRFYRRTLLAEMTATWCWSCHFMIDAIHYCTEDLLYDRAIPVAFHDVQSEQGNLHDQFGLIMTTYYPQLAGNMPSYVMDWNAQYTSHSTFANLEASTPDMVDDILGSQAIDQNPVGIAVETSLTGHTVECRIDIMVRERQEYWLGVVLVEDRIEGYQHSAPDPFYHMNVGQMIVYPEDGSKLAASIGWMDPDTSKEWTSGRLEFVIPASCDPENCRLVAYVCKSSSDVASAPLGFLVSNAVSCPVGESVGYQYEPLVE